MHISAERFITTLQYPLAPPLPLLTDGAYSNDRDFAACAILVGSAVDASVTAVTRLVVTPLLVIPGAARWGWHGAHIKSSAMLPLAFLGLMFGTALGTVGAAFSACRALGLVVEAGLLLAELVGHVAAAIMACLLRTWAYVCPSGPYTALGGV